MQKSELNELERIRQFDIFSAKASVKTMEQCIVSLARTNSKRNERMLPAIFIGLFSIIFSFLLAVSFVIFAIVPALPVTLSLLTALVLGNLVIAFFAIKKSVHSVIALIGFAIGSFIMMFSMSKEGPSLSLDVIEFPALATVVFASVYAVCYWLLKKTILKDTTEVQAA